MVLGGILEKLSGEREPLTRELNRITRMIRAAGKGTHAAVKEYEPQRGKTGRRARIWRS